MNTETVSVLLMDDEPSSAIIQAAVQRLEEEGFEVTPVETMSDAIQSYYDTFYQVFILDIDMDDHKDDGVNVLKSFISLHNQTQVIMFSGAGTVPDWFEAANAHCFGYIHKNENNKLDNLVAMIKNSLKEEPAPPKRKPSKLPERILAFCENQNYADNVEQAVRQTLGDQWETVFTASLEETAQKLQSEDYGIGIILQEVFKLRAKEKELLREILTQSPRPQMLVGCLGQDELQHSILFIANLHPFRMINTKHEDWPQHLESALQKAVTWYGQREIFPAAPDALKRMHITLPPDALSEWENFSPEDMEELYDAYADAENDEQEEL